MRRCTLRRPRPGAAAGLTSALALALAAAEAGAAPRPLADDELAAVRGADGVAFNLSNFSLTSIADYPLGLTYYAPSGGALTLSRIDMSRTDDSDPFADPYALYAFGRTGLADVLALDFPQNPLATGNQKWTFTADFSNCSLYAGGVCTGTSFEGGTLQITGLALRGGGLYLSAPTLAGTDGIAFGLGTRLDIDSLAVYPHGRSATDVVDTTESLVLGGIHLFDANSLGAWMLADVTNQPGLFNAQTDATGSYLHFQIGWPAAGYTIPSGALQIDNITFSTNGTPTFQINNPGVPAASIASIQINYMDMKLRP